jgi:hypothetical protein
MEIYHRPRGQNVKTIATSTPNVLDLIMNTKVILVICGPCVENSKQTHPGDRWMIGLIALNQRMLIVFWELLSEHLIAQHLVELLLNLPQHLLLDLVVVTLAYMRVNPATDHVLLPQKW